MTCPCYPQWSMVFLWNSIKLLVWFILLHFSESGGKASERQFILELIKKKKKAGGKRKFYLHTYAVGLILKNFSLPFLEVAFSLSLEKARGLKKKNMGENDSTPSDYQNQYQKRFQQQCNDSSVFMKTCRQIDTFWTNSHQFCNDTFDLAGPPQL